MIIYTLPLIGALIGWLTNYVAIKMLFHPKSEIKIFFFSLQGIFPKRQRAFAEKLGQVVSTELLTAQEVTAHLKEKATSEAVLAHIAMRLEEGIASRLPRAFPMLAMFMSSKNAEKLKRVLLEQISGLNEELIDKLSGELEKELDVQGIVEEKVSAFSSDKLEEILFSIMRREFKFIEVVGAVLGFFIGLIQILLLSFVG